MEKWVMLLLTFIGSSTGAFTLSTVYQNQQGFQHQPIDVYINPTNCPSYIEDVVSSAIEVWHSAPTSDLRLRMAGNTSTSITTLKTNNFSEDIVIACSINIASDTNSAYTASQIAGVGTAIPSSSGVLLRGYLLINMENSGGSLIFTQLDSNRQDVLVAHELGHVLGLGHSPYSGALMYFDITEKTGLGLHQDDIDGISYLYPRANGGCGMIGTPELPGSGPGLWLFLTLPLLFLIALRARPVLG